MMEPILAGEGGGKREREEERGRLGIYLYSGRTKSAMVFGSPS